MGSFWTPHYKSWKNRSNYDWGLSCSITFENTNIDSVSVHQHEINTDGTIELDAPIANSESRKKYLRAYNKVDIALDSFPYSGNATSFEAIWMGVPVLTKKGSTFISHSTESINYNCGMSDWIAKDENEYLTKAIKFSANFKQLSEIKMNLRKTALNSPLFKATLFADQFNEAVWKMWNNFI